MSNLVIDDQIFYPTPNFRYDYIYLLNYKGITNSVDGFTSNETRLIQSTNYAKSLGNDINVDKTGKGYNVSSY